MKLSLQAEKIHLVELRYFDSEHNGIEVSKPLSYGFLLELNDVGQKYLNIFDFEESYPVYKRVPYGNTLADGTSYGTKVVLDDGEEKDGPCWVLTGQTGSDIFKRKYMMANQLEDYMLKSSEYFKDRIKIARERRSEFDHPLEMSKIIRRDKVLKKEMDEFFEERAKKKEKVKTKK